MIARLIDVICALFAIFVIAISSFVVNLSQIIMKYMVFLPVKERLSRMQDLANTLWDEFVFAVEVLGGVHYQFYNEAVHDGETALLMGNHDKGADFISGVCVVGRAPKVGTGRAMVMMKKSLSYVPIVGWTHVLQGSIFLKRNYEKDRKALTAKFDEMNDANRYPRPFWIGIFPEGTRMTKKKKELSHEYARKNNLPLLEHVLLPRTKGFVLLCDSLKDTLEYVYDITLAYSTSSLFLSDFVLTGKFKTTTVHCYVDRIPFHTIPKDQAGQEKWLIQQFKKKDDLLKFYHEHGFFPGQRIDDSKKADQYHWQCQRAFLGYASLLMLFFGWLLGGQEPYQVQRQRYFMIGFGLMSLLTYIVSSYHLKQTKKRVAKENEKWAEWVKKQQQVPQLPQQQQQ